MGELLILRRPDVAVRLEDVYRFAGVKSFGGGVFQSVVKTGSEFAYRQLIRVKTDDFVYPKLMAWEGALGIVPGECDGMVVSPEFCVFTVNRDEVRPAFLDIYFRQPHVWPQLAGASAGTNVRRRRIYPENFLKFIVSLPTLVAQDYVVDVGRRARLAREAQSALLAEIDALVPAVLREVCSSAIPKPEA
jgi:type I restriction enzyme S subunit